MDPNLDNEVIAAFLKLARAMRRCPPEKREMPFPPAIGRLLECAAANPGAVRAAGPASLFPERDAGPGGSGRPADPHRGRE